jgi:hypothetical protein
MILPPWLLAFGADVTALCDELVRRRVTSQSAPPVTSQESVTLHCPTGAARRRTVSAFGGIAPAPHLTPRAIAWRASVSALAGIARSRSLRASRAIATSTAASTTWRG